jgi:hypothetical protein
MSDQLAAATPVGLADHSPRDRGDGVVTQPDQMHPVSDQYRVRQRFANRVGIKKPTGRWTCDVVSFRWPVHRARRLSPRDCKSCWTQIYGGMVTNDCALDGHVLTAPPLAGPSGSAERSRPSRDGTRPPAGTPTAPPGRRTTARSTAGPPARHRRPGRR